MITKYAEQFYLKSLEIDPQNFEAHYLIGNLYMDNLNYPNRAENY